jgi:3-isopropylmalate dehydrogenase
VKPRVAVISGDGIGPEVIGVALDRYGAELDTTMLDAGAVRYLDTGEVLTDSELDTCSASDAVLFGAVGDPRVPEGTLERGILLRLRSELDLYINLRPFPELGLVIVRENTEGLYSGVGARSRDAALEVSVNTASGVQRCVSYAFDLAARRSGRLCLVHKTNVLSHAGGLWSEIVSNESGSYPGVEVAYEHIDAAAYHVVTDPSRFDVIVTDNLFGDILSDVAAGAAEGLGRAAGANLHPDPDTRPTRCVGLFEPIHGSAPDISGRGIADPTAALRATEMLLDAVKDRREAVSP